MLEKHNIYYKNCKRDIILQRMVEDIFLLHTPLELAQELDARWTESVLRAKLANVGQWVPFASPRIHAELRLIASCNRAFLDPSFDMYDLWKPAAVWITSSHDIYMLCALWVTVYNCHFGTHFKVSLMGGSVKMDQNWAFVLSPRKRPDQDVSKLVYDLLENELEHLQDASRAPWGVLLRSLTSWTCLFKPNKTLLVMIIPFLGGGTIGETEANEQFRHSLVHDCVQRLHDVEIYFVVVIPNTCLPPRDRARERAHIICGWPCEPGHASNGKDLGYERGMKNDVS